MVKYDLRKLLRSSRKADLTKEEHQFLMSYYNLCQNEPDAIDRLSTEKKNEIKSEIQEKIWDNIIEDRKLHQKRSFIKMRYIKMTAAAAIFIASMTSLFFLFNSISERRSLATPTSQPTVKLLSTNVAVNLPLERKENRFLLLPDGSTVTLSPGSKLNYPSTFDGMKRREVFLHGQAFFDIKHNVSRPFIVHTGNLEIKVLGTAFNIKALPNETDIIVTVKRGKVKVSDQNKSLGVITPNQQITYDLKKVSSTFKKLDDDTYLDWKEQDLLLDNVTVAGAAKLLEERYNVKIIISEPSLGSQRFTTTFKKNKSLEEVLKSICVFNGVVYKYDKEKTTVTLSNKLII